MKQLSRRDLVRGCGALIALPILGKQERGAAQLTISLDQNWRFGGTGSEVTLPHCVVPLSWQEWNPENWEKIWVYRREFSLPHEIAGHRVFLDFDHVMAAATPTINGRALPEHVGGFLPFRYEITGIVQQQNVLEVAVDSRWLDVPPTGSPKGPKSIDYLLPGGITGSVHLRAVPQVFLSDVFAKPVDVLSSGRRLELSCTLDAGTAVNQSIRVEAALRDRTRTIAKTAKDLSALQAGETAVDLTLTGLGGAQLWDVDEPHLYDLTVTLFLQNKPLHDYRVRVGLREARFELDGFFLNGRRVQIFGLNRHELYPYVGRAMPARVLRKDAEILKREFHCNAVRCSHYPPSEAFLDACDELGLVVWEELPGWQYIGGERWRDLAVRDVEEMVRRDRNHPSTVIWGVRINESRNDPPFYRRTKEAANRLDGTRQTSGSMVYRTTQDWLQDVFAYDDYHSAPDGSVGLIPPVPGVPFFFSEAVGQFSYGERGFHNYYRRAGDAEMQMKQAIYHAQVHDRGAADKRYGGVIAWCAFEYGSLLNDYRGVKYPGVADVFRIPKLGASFYRAQVDPKIQPVIEPNFYWDFGPQTSQGPGERAAIFSNCERLELSIDGKHYATLLPDRKGFPRLRYPPFFVDLRMDGTRKPELRIDGYSNGMLALSRSFSSDTSTDRLLVQADDPEISGDGSDATRLVVRAVDKFGAQRPFVRGEVRFSTTGPGVLVGDNPLSLTDCGGAGAVWIKSRPRSRGRIRVEATHERLGSRAVEIVVGQSV